jgi:hypothetical protein
MLGLEADKVAASAGNGGEGDADLAAVRARIQKRGKKPTGAEALKARHEEQLIDDLYDEKNWSEVAGLYFNVRYAMTGHSGFLLTENESAVLTSSTAMVMRTLIQLDPRYVALVIFATNFGAVVARKEAGYSAIKKIDGGKSPEKKPVVSSI